MKLALFGYGGHAFEMSKNEIPFFEVALNLFTQRSCYSD
jgi:hypothetical protein